MLSEGRLAELKREASEATVCVKAGEVEEFVDATLKLDRVLRLLADLPAPGELCPWPKASWDAGFWYGQKRIADELRAIIAAGRGAPDGSEQVARWAEQ